MNTFNRVTPTPTTNTKWKGPTTQKVEYRRVYVPEQTTQRVYNQPTQYRGQSPGYSSNNRRVRSVNVNRPEHTMITNQVKYVPVQPPPSKPSIGLDAINNNLIYNQKRRTTTTQNQYGMSSQQRPPSIRNSSQQRHVQVMSIPSQSSKYRQPSSHSKNEYNPPIQRNILQKTINRKSREKFVSNPTERVGEKIPSNGVTVSDRNNNTEIYTSNIKTSQILKNHPTLKNSVIRQTDSNIYEREVKYQSILPGSNMQPNSSGSQFMGQSNSNQRNFNSRSRKSKSSRNDSTGRIKGDTFINIPKVKTDYGIMKNNAQYKPPKNTFYNRKGDPYAQNTQGFSNKIKDSNEMLTGFNSAEKNKKQEELFEYQQTLNNIDSNKLFKNNYQIENRNRFGLTEDIFGQSDNFIDTLRNKNQSRNASRSRSRLANRDLIGRSVEKGHRVKESGQPSKLDPFSYKYNFSPAPAKRVEAKQSPAPQGRMYEVPKSRYDDTAITFDPIIERKVRALPKEKVEKALFNSNNIKSIDELKDKIMKKNEILMRLKAQHMKLMQDPKNPENLRSQLEMREKQNKKILEKIKKIKEQTEQKKEEYKELIEIDNQMKTLLSMMTESEKKERDRLIAELKRTDELYMKTKRENEQLKSQMEDSSKGMVFKQHLIDEEVNRVKSMIEDQLEDDYEKGNQMLINQIQKMYNKLMAAKN